MKVYLAGPISGLTYEDGQEWRNQACAMLLAEGIAGYSPLRGKADLKTEGILKGSYEKNPSSRAKSLVCRDRNDVMTADAVLFYLLDAKIVSIGTCVEYGWADAYRKPTVTVIETGNIHTHPFVDELSGFKVESLNAAVAVLKRILKP